MSKDGRIAIEKYFGTFTRGSNWHWASAGKTMTAALVGIAQQEGFLSIADVSSRWMGHGWTSFAPEKEDRITVWRRLTMTSGLDDGAGAHFFRCLSMRPPNRAQEFCY